MLRQNNNVIAIFEVNKLWRETQYKHTTMSLTTQVLISNH